ncbi:Response regulator receiver protein (modular protein) [Verrucomicrobia bacterium]|nr:Response regulator receiver protein (modular protein) [Verrucomicrobiota bacterium]
MRRRVLIIDDDPAVRASISRVLQAAGYDVATAGNAQDATVRFGSESIDLVLLDLNLPPESGWDVFERLSARLPLVPIIIITGMTNQARTALAAGVGALFEKPIEVPALLETMDQLFAESPETRLRRMCGYQDDTRIVRSQQHGGLANSTDEAPAVQRRPWSRRLECRRGK